MRNYFYHGLQGGLLGIGLLCFTACASQKTIPQNTSQEEKHYQLVSAVASRHEIGPDSDVSPNAEAVNLLATYKLRVDSIMSPVIGQSTHFMEGKAPESDLSNLIADALRHASLKYTGEEADVAIFNFGGIRSTLPEGPVTFGNIFEITPFENTLVTLKLKGSDLTRLFEQMCAITNGCLSGANIVSQNHKLVSAKVGGKDIDPDKVYTLATIDYVAEGNDHFTVLQEFRDWNMPEGATLRQCFLDYVAWFTEKGEKIDAKVEGRFIIKQ